MRSIALAPGSAGQQYCWPSLDHINAILAISGDVGVEGVSVAKIEPYYEGIAKRGFAKVFCVPQDEKLSDAYRSFFNKHGFCDPAYNNCILIAPSKLAHHVDVFTLRWLDLSHQGEQPESVPTELAAHQSGGDPQFPESGLEAFYSPR